MNVHIFGKNNSPCIANFSLKQSTTDQQNEFSRFITESVDKDFYVGDLLKSSECVKDLISLATQLLQLLLNKIFRLTKWIKNSKTILDQLSSTETEIKNKAKYLTYRSRNQTL